MAVAGTKEGCCGQGSMPLLNRAVRVIYSCLTGSAPNTLPSHTNVLALSNYKMSYIENSEFSGMGLLKKPP